MTCVVCGGDPAAQQVAGTRFSACSDCGYRWLEQAPEEKRDYWAGDDASGEDPSYWVGDRAAYFDSALDLLEAASDGRRLLDVGGGVGFFAQRAGERGWDAYSLDSSTAVTARAVKRIAQDRALTDLAAVEDSSFDVATMWCVVAHVDDPLTLVRDVVSKLRPGGLLWVTTPNFAFQRRYAQARSLAGKPLDFLAEDHVGHFTTVSLAELLSRAGFDRVRWEFRGMSEMCTMTKSRSSRVLRAKRGWNRTAHAAASIGLPNRMSELQCLARKSSG